MKRIFALLFALVACLGMFAGCKKNQPAATTAPATDQVTGQTQTAGSITLLVPEGWTLSAEETDPNQVYLYKGEAGSGTYIRLHLFPGTQAYLPDTASCNNTQKLETRTYGSYSWSGFSGTKLTGAGTCPVTYLATQAEGNNYLATLWQDPDSAPISVEDADVQAILASISAPEPKPLETEPVTESTAAPTGDGVMEETAPPTTETTSESSESEEPVGDPNNSPNEIMVEEEKP